MMSGSKTSTIKAIAAEGRHSCAVLGDQKKRRDIWLTVLQRCCEFCARNRQTNNDVRQRRTDIKASADAWL